MTEDRTAQIRARLAAASKGDWGTSHIDPTHVRAYDPNGFGAYNPVAVTQGRTDAEFIANAREDIPWLLDQLDKARAEAAHMQREFDLLRVMKAPPAPKFDTFGANHTDVTKWPYRKEANGGD